MRHSRTGRCWCQESGALHCQCGRASGCSTVVQHHACCATATGTQQRAASTVCSKWSLIRTATITATCMEMHRVDPWLLGSRLCRFVAPSIGPFTIGSQSIVQIISFSYLWALFRGKNVSAPPRSIPLVPRSNARTCGVAGPCGARAQACLLCG
jgi:hypothetical protein